MLNHAISLLSSFLSDGIVNGFIYPVLCLFFLAWVPYFVRYLVGGHLNV